ncbi:hypothetical protein SLEP1_g52423 [Rubroshorea leprosula]|uniref:Transmembrane protein n=1 Tax=Rubroshorea leprosula TaxID=152421 RepID=A0AAV5M8U5_9ROSI|nr:hypothetical protein SLEP1_g52423 [Rubroshorea leprosula]
MQRRNPKQRFLISSVQIRNHNSSVLHQIFILSPSPRSFSLSIGRSSYFFCSTSDFHLLTEVVLSLDPLRPENFSSPVLFRYRITFRLQLAALLCISLLYLILILLLFFIRFSSFSRSRSLSGSSSTVRPEIFLLRFPSGTEQ